MTSSQIPESGKMHGARSNFSQTCNLLSQYLKKNGSFGDLNLCLTPSSDKGAPTETMNLLSMIEKSDSRNPNPPPAAAVKEETQIKPEAATAPMTIFYAGQVIVFNDFPAEKAKEIMALASTGTKWPTAVSVPPFVAQKPAESAAIISNITKPSFSSAQPPLDSDLPIARKNSLSRFLEKRRDRITAIAPYPAPKQVKAEAEAEAWLGLAPQQLPFQIQRE